MSFTSRSSRSFNGLEPSGLGGAELVDLDSLLNNCLEDVQPGVLDYRQRLSTGLGEFDALSSELKGEDLDPIDILLPGDSWPPQAPSASVAAVDNSKDHTASEPDSFFASFPSVPEAAASRANTPQSGLAAQLLEAQRQHQQQSGPVEAQLQPHHLQAVGLGGSSTLNPSQATDTAWPSTNSFSAPGDSPFFSMGEKPAPPSPSASDGTEPLSRGKGTLAERNKQAQRRHRMRARMKVDSLEATVERLQTEKAELASEKAALQGQVAMLTHVLHMRDEQLNQARQESGAIPSVPAAFPKGGAAPVDALTQDVLTLTVRDDQEIRLTPAQVKSMGPEDLARLWKEYINQLALVLGRAGEGPVQEPAATRMKKLVQETQLLLMKASLSNPSTMKRFVVDKVDKSQLHCLEDTKELWGEAARALKLSPAQHNAVMRLRTLYLERQEQLQQERVSALSGLMSTSPDGVRGRDIATQYIRAEQCIGQLRQQLTQENTLICDMVSTFFTKILSPEQTARCLVRSYPWYPDSLAMCTHLAADMGDRAAAELIHRIPASPSSSLQHAHSSSLSQNSA